MNNEEFIGSKIKIIDSKNKSNIGITGKVINETKNTLVIKTKENKKTLMKNNITFTTNIDGKTYEINGEKINKRHHERIILTR